MGDSEEETFRKLSVDTGIPSVTDGEAQARQFFGDAGYDALVAQIAQTTALETGQKIAVIDLLKSRATFNNLVATSIAWLAFASTALATWIIVVR